MPDIDASLFLSGTVVFLASMTQGAAGFGAALVAMPLLVHWMDIRSVTPLVALLIIPLGCISARKQFYVETADDGTVSVSPMFERIEKPDVAVAKEAAAPRGTPLWMRLYCGIMSVFTWVFYFVRAVFTMIAMGFKGILGKFGGGGKTPPPPRQPSPGGTPPPPPSGGTPPPPRQPPPGGTPPPPREPPPTPPKPVMASATPEPAVSSAPEPAVSSAPEPVVSSAPAEAVISADDADESGETPEMAIVADVPEEEDATDVIVAEAPDVEDATDVIVAEAPDVEDATDVDEGIARKRRGIRLKQDLS